LQNLARLSYAQIKEIKKALILAYCKPKKYLDMIMDSKSIVMLPNIPKTDNCIWWIWASVRMKKMFFDSGPRL